MTVLSETRRGVQHISDDQAHRRKAIKAHIIKVIERAKEADDRARGALRQPMYLHKRDHPISDLKAMC
jgi:hypothetical protein